ncbi:hypothetical protein [Sorangium sp. So ce385]|uniref:hypothetical protein n=1 Tax=Sorangium sp. So ce385 TaxID=3133308 RepID=UPI003F5B79C8
MVLSSCKRTIPFLALPLVTAACIGAEVDARDGLAVDELDELVGEAESALENGNGMLANALSPNALSPNALSPNALSPNALSPNALSPNALSAIRDTGTNGTLSRSLLRYVVSCALTPDQTFSFSWTDSGGVVHQETYRGDLGFAPWWAYQALSDDYQKEWVTACLASRTNWYGVSVVISSRGPHSKTSSTPTERQQYSMREGAFWGNLFSPTPYVQACYSSTGVTRARQLQRDCAAGHLAGGSAVQQCGAINIVGACDSICAVAPPPTDGTTPSNHFNSCTIGGNPRYNVLTTFLTP